MCGRGHTPGNRCFPTRPARTPPAWSRRVGAGVTKVAPGDRVYTSGTTTGAYAEKALCEENQLHRLAAGVTFAQGAAVNIPYATAYRALFQTAKAAPGETVLIHGATGGVGIAAVQLARAAGLVVVGTGGTEKGRELVMEQGAHYTLDHGNPDHLEGLASLTGGRGADIIIEMLANVNLDKDLKALAARGGWSWSAAAAASRSTPGISCPARPRYRVRCFIMMTEREEAGLRAALSAGLDNGTLKPVVGRELPLSAAAEAHRRIMESGACGKIVLVP